MLQLEVIYVHDHYSSTYQESVLFEADWSHILLYILLAGEQQS